MRKLLLCLALTTIYLFSNAQRFGGHPASTRWRQINTDTVRVIFPAGLEKQAADVAITTHRLGLTTVSTLGDRLHKISIVLQPYTTVSNGYVSLGPRRSEFLLTPEQNSFNLGSLPWYHTLALHEYRHVQQYNNFNKGLSKFMYILFGEDGLSLANSAAVPNWFWEGDAVYQESLMSGQGRGRLPFFYNDYRSLWAAGKNYSWMKLRNGSLKDFVPDHYRLGYMMVAYGREKYGPDFWKKVTDDAVRYKGLFYPFQRAVKKYAGVDYKTFRENTLQYYQKTAGDTIDPAFRPGPKHFLVDEEFPQWIDDNRIVMVKSSYKKIPAFYVLDVQGGKTTKIRVRDISLDNYFSYRNGKIVYAAYETNPRWDWIDYSVLKVLDVETGSQQTITHKTKYFSPDISADGQRIVAVHVEPGKDAELNILQSNGALIKKIPNPQHLFYTYPKFYDEHTVVSAIRSGAGSMTLGLVNIEDGHIEELLPNSMHVIGFPSVRNDTITFTASFEGRDQLFGLFNKALFRFRADEINSSTGNYQLDILHSKAAWTAFTATGYLLMRSNISADRWTPVGKQQFADAAFPETISLLKPATAIGADTTHPYPITHYSKGFRLFNFHSRRPLINDPDYTFSFISDNVLNTMQAEVFFNYNTEEKFKEVGAALLYGQLFPYINAGVSEVFDRNSGDTVTWNEFNANAGLQVPLQFTSGSSYKNLTFSAGLNSRQVTYTKQSKNVFADRQFNNYDLSLLFTIQSQTARQHIYPRLGLTAFTRYRSIINKYTGNQWLSSGGLYLPGILPIHNLVITGAYQSRDTMQQYVFSNSFPFSRGYSNINFPRMWKAGFNYHFPLFCPDWGFANMIYFLRVRANAYYDYSEIKSLRTGNRFQFRSYGGEIFFDTKWWNEYAVSFGIRYSRLIDGQLLGLAPNQWEIILPVNLLGR